MLSYLLATNRPIEWAKKTVDSIQSLKPHDYEIVICSPNEDIQKLTNERVKYVFDDVNFSSNYAFNKCFDNCSGDWVTLVTDDHTTHLDVDRLFSVMYSEEMQKQKYQILNLGDWWGISLGHTFNQDPGWYNEIGVNIIAPEVYARLHNYYYPVITFPCISSKTIREQFKGVVFHPKIIHHYVDHWMGIYTTLKDPNIPFTLYGKSSIWDIHTHQNNCITKHDPVDRRVFLEIATRALTTPIESLTYI